MASDSEIAAAKQGAQKLTDWVNDIIGNNPALSSCLPKFTLGEVTIGDAKSSVSNPNFTADDIGYLQRNNVKIEHYRTFSGQAGISYSDEGLVKFLDIGNGIPVSAQAMERSLSRINEELGISLPSFVNVDDDGLSIKYPSHPATLKAIDDIIGNARARDIVAEEVAQPMACLSQSEPQMPQGSTLTAYARNRETTPSTQI